MTESNCLDKLKILSALPNDLHLELFDSIASTADYAKSQSHLPTPRVILAEEQTAGYGRMGRPWTSPYGTQIYYTLIWDYYGPTALLSTLSLRVAMSVVHTLQDQGIRGIQLKWPNDLVFQSKKLGGVLIHSQSGMHGCTRLCISLGLNVTPLPPYASLQELSGKHHDRNALVVAITQRLLRDLAEFTLQTSDEWMQEWAVLDALRDQNIVLHQSAHTVSGIARGINEHGQLIVEDSNGNHHKFNAGDVTTSDNRWPE